MIDISIVTLNYKEALLTGKCIKTLLKQKRINFEIIIVDNSCSSREKNILTELSDKRIRLFFPKKNLGCSAGYNYAIKRSRGKFIFILNNDTEISDKYALVKLKKFFNKGRKIGIIQPKIKSLYHHDRFEYAGAAGGYLDILGYPFCRGRIFQTVEKDYNQYNNEVDITWASTCAFFTKKNLIKKAGLFDPLYFAYAEEIDISLKMWILGYRVVYCPGVEIFHKGESSWKKRRGIKTYFIHRNHLMLFLKCYPLKHIVLYFPARFILEALSAFFYLINKSELHIIFIWFSHLSIIILMKKIILNRRTFFNGMKSNPAPIYKKSIVVEYFFNKKKHFKQLNKNEFTAI